MVKILSICTIVDFNLLILILVLMPSILLQTWQKFAYVAEFLLESTEQLNSPYHIGSYPGTRQAKIFFISSLTQILKPGREDDDWVHAPPKRHHFRQGPRPPRLHHKPSSIPLSFRQTQKHRGQNIGGGVHVGAKKVYAEEEEN